MTIVRQATGVFVSGALGLMAGVAAAQPAQTIMGPIAIGHLDAKPGRQIDPVLRRQLQDHLAKWSSDSQTKRTTLIRWSDIRLLNNHREVVVYVSGGGDPQFGEMGGWCGTGSCRIYIFEARAQNYGRIGSLQAWLPIRVLPESHDGHPDLSFWVQGGGVYPGYASRIVFHKGSYPMDGGQRDGHKVPAKAGAPLLNENQAGARLFP